MEKGNRAKLVNSEVCMACGRCCKEFTFCTDINEGVRFKWMDNKKIKTEDTLFRFRDSGEQMKSVIFDFPCCRLEFKNGKYSCSAYNEERPNFCSTYPDHIFYNVERWDKDRIKKLLQYERKNCIGLKNITIKDVINMLNERRKDNLED